MDSTQPPSSKPHRVAPADISSPQGAWQEEESLEVYRRKRTQKPPADGSAEIVRFVKRHPDSTGEVYETVQPRRDGRREIILLEPVQVRDQSPELLYDDYSLYRMEEYVDASSELGSPDKDPVYYTVEKHEKEHGSRITSEKEKKVDEECLSPSKEIETYSFVQESREEVRKDVDTRSSREHVEATSTREHRIGTPTPFELCDYRPPVAAHDDVAEEVAIDRVSTGDRSEKACSQCGKDVRSSETPLLDRTVYYEREVVQGDRTPDRESGHTHVVDEEIAQANRKVDAVLREQAATVPRSPQPSIQSVAQEGRRDDRHGVEERTSMRYEKDRSEKFLEVPAPQQDKGRTAAEADLHRGGRTSRTSDHVRDYQKYERTSYDIRPPSRPISAGRSSHNGSLRSGHSPCCRHRCGSREHERMMMQEKRTVRDIPIRAEQRPSPTPHPETHPPPRQSSTQRTQPTTRKASNGGRLPPITEIITTERFERVERVRRRYPVTPV